MIYDLQKANSLKRFMAFLLDLIILIIFVTGFMWIVSSITNYDSYSDAMSNEIAKIEESFGISDIVKQYDVDLDKFSTMSEEEKNKLPQDVVIALEDCIKSINSNPKISEAYIMMMNLTLLMVSVSFLLSFVILELIVPAIFKNGQTIGKKIFSLAVMRIDGVKVTPLIMFVRSILGKYTVETMIPLIIILMAFYGVANIVMLMVIPLILLFELILIIATKTNSMIHDILSSTVLVDLQSQMIFDSVEAKNEYRLHLHNEEVKESKYF